MNSMEKILLKICGVRLGRIGIAYLIILVACLFSVPVAEGVTSIMVMHIWDSSRTPVLEAATRQFEAENPDIKVELQLVPQGQAFYDKLVVMVTAGAVPDVAMVDNNGGLYYQAAVEGILLPLDQLIARDRLRVSDYVPSAFNSVQVNNVVYGLPAVISGPHMLYYKKDAFAEAGLSPDYPPNSWEDLTRITLKTTLRTADRITRVGIDTRGLNHYISFMTNGCQYLSADWTRVNIGSRNFYEVAEYHAGLTESAYGSFAGMVTALGTSVYSKQLATQKAVMALAGPFGYQEIVAAGANFNMATAPLPHGPNGKITGNIWANFVYTIPKGTKNVEAAWKYAKYIGYGDGMRELMAGMSRPSPVLSHNRDTRLVRALANLDTIQLLLNNAEMIPRHPAITTIMDNATKAFTTVLNRKQAAQPAFEEAQRQAQVILDEWNQRLGIAGKLSR